MGCLSRVDFPGRKQGLQPKLKSRATVLDDEHVLQCGERGPSSKPISSRVVSGYATSARIQLHQCWGRIYPFFVSEQRTSRPASTPSSRWLVRRRLVLPQESARFRPTWEQPAPIDKVRPFNCTVAQRTRKIARIDF